MYAAKEEKQYLRIICSSPQRLNSGTTVSKSWDQTISFSKVAYQDYRLKVTGAGAEDNWNREGQTVSGVQISYTTSGKVTLSVPGTGAVELPQTVTVETRIAATPTTSASSVVSTDFTFTKATNTAFTITPDSQSVRVGDTVGITVSGFNGILEHRVDSGDSGLLSMVSEGFSEVGKYTSQWRAMRAGSVNLVFSDDATRYYQMSSKSVGFTILPRLAPTTQSRPWDQTISFAKGSGQQYRLKVTGAGAEDNWDREGQTVSGVQISYTTSGKVTLSVPGTGAVELPQTVTVETRIAATATTSASSVAHTDFTFTKAQPALAMFKYDGQSKSYVAVPDTLTIGGNIILSTTGIPPITGQSSDCGASGTLVKLQFTQSGGSGAVAVGALCPGTSRYNIGIQGTKVGSVTVQTAYAGSSLYLPASITKDIRILPTSGTPTAPLTSSGSWDQQITFDKTAAQQYRLKVTGAGAEDNWDREGQTVSGVQISYTTSGKVTLSVPDTGAVTLPQTVTVETRIAATATTSASSVVSTDFTFTKAAPSLSIAIPYQGDRFFVKEQLVIFLSGVPDTVSKSALKFVQTNITATSGKIYLSFLHKRGSVKGQWEVVAHGTKPGLVTLRLSLANSLYASTVSKTIVMEKAEPVAANRPNGGTAIRHAYDSPITFDKADGQQYRLKVTGAGAEDNWDREGQTLSGVKISYATAGKVTLTPDLSKVVLPVTVAVETSRPETDTTASSDIVETDFTFKKAQPLLTVTASRDTVVSGQGITVTVAGAPSGITPTLTASTDSGDGTVRIGTATASGSDTTFSVAGINGGPVTLTASVTESVLSFSATSSEKSITVIKKVRRVTAPTAASDVWKDIITFDKTDSQQYRLKATDAGAEDNWDREGQTVSGVQISYATSGKVTLSIPHVSAVTLPQTVTVETRIAATATTSASSVAHTDFTFTKAPSAIFAYEFQPGNHSKRIPVGTVLTIIAVGYTEPWRKNVTVTFDEGSPDNFYAPTSKGIDALLFWENRTKKPGVVTMVVHDKGNALYAPGQTSITFVITKSQNTSTPAKPDGQSHVYDTPISFNRTAGQQYRLKVTGAAADANWDSEGQTVSGVQISYTTSGKVTLSIPHVSAVTLPQMVTVETRIKETATAYASQITSRDFTFTKKPSAISATVTPSGGLALDASSTVSVTGNIGGVTLAQTGKTSTSGGVTVGSGEKQSDGSTTFAVTAGASADDLGSVTLTASDIGDDLTAAGTSSVTFNVIKKTPPPAVKPALKGWFWDQSRLLWIQYIRKVPGQEYRMKSWASTMTSYPNPGVQFTGWDSNYDRIWKNHPHPNEYLDHTKIFFDDRPGYITLGNTAGDAQIVIQTRVKETPTTFASAIVESRAR